MPSEPAGPWGVILERLESATRPRYRVLRLIGYGGMAGVYLAEEPRLGRRVAIKVMAPGLMVDPALINRFEQEARTTAQLSHPNIVTVYDVDERDGLHYFVMAFVAGRTLGQIMSERPEPLPIAGVRHWLAQVGSALTYAHRSGVVHRDVKPGNVLVDADGNAHVTDFGIAKVGDSPSLTRSGFLVGTPAYMSPEQCVSSPVTGASDQYSLAVVAYEMLTGVPPFTGQTLAVLHAHVHEPARSLIELRPDCPPDLAAAIDRMLAKRPEERFPDVADAVAAAGALRLADRDPLRTELGGLTGAEHTPVVTPVPARERVAPTPAPERVSPAPARDPATPAPAAEIPHLELVPGRGLIRTGETLFLETRGGESDTAERLEWSSSDPNIARVTDGSLVALRPGVVTITATTGEQSAAATFQVEPAAPVAGPVSSATAFEVAPAAQVPGPTSSGTAVESEPTGTPARETPAAGPAPGAMPSARSHTGRTPAPPRRYLPRAAAATIVIVAVAGVIVLTRGPDPEATPGDEPVPQAGAPTVTTGAEAEQPADPPDADPLASGDSVGPAAVDQAVTDAGEGQTIRAEPPAEDRQAPPSEDRSATPPPAPPRDGTVRIAGALPAYTELIVTGADGTARPVSGGSIALRPGQYTLEARAPDGRTATQQITVRAGATETWSPELAATPPEPTTGAQPYGAPAPGAGEAAGAEEQVRNVLGAFVDALESRDLDAVARQYPGAGGEWSDQWKPFYESRDVRSLSTRLVRVGSVSIEGDAARAAFTIEMSYNDLYNTRQQPTFQFEAVLRRIDGTWSLIDLRQIQ
ncbi:MAG: protein kinase domain-containing protein [Longimicrobiales bacterium]